MKIDYEITVDVSNADIETKKRLLDAFLKLGFSRLYIEDTYDHSNAEVFTNTYCGNVVDDQLTHSWGARKPTHTIDQLLELAGMKTKTDSIPFDLEKALAGDLVVMRNGREVTQVTLFECESRYPLLAVVDGEVCSFTKMGEHYDNGQPSQHDLFMKPKTRIINGFEVPAPETKAPDYRTEYCFPQINDDDFHDWYCWCGDDVDNRILSRNLLFLTKEAAIANAKAMLGIDPYGDDD